MKDVTQALSIKPLLKLANLGQASRLAKALRARGIRVEKVF
jgi:hypothetical protein